MADERFFIGCQDIPVAYSYPTVLASTSRNLESGASVSVFKVKICGIARVADVPLVAASGADAIGLNFCSRSPRQVSINVASIIARTVGRRMLVVGVFVNDTLDQIRRITELVGLDAVQLHGDEPFSNQWERLELPVIKAIRFAADTRLGQDPWVRENAEFLAAMLIDASLDGQFGGTGKQVDWPSLATASDSLQIPVILAGGLSPANVATAIELVRPAGVDVASGVESAPGVKDARRMSDFVQNALCALKQTSRSDQR